MSRKACWLLAVALVGGLASSAAHAQETMQWVGGFPAIAMAPMATRTQICTGSSTTTLLLTGDAEISADNSAAAQLTGPGGDTLITEYSLAFDGDGHGATGGPATGYTAYDSFLDPAVEITHAPGDDDVNVTLYVRAQTPTGDVANAGDYTAAATLTVTWIGP